MASRRLWIDVGDSTRMTKKHSGDFRIIEAFIVQLSNRMIKKFSQRKFYEIAFMCFVSIVRSADDANAFHMFDTHCMLYSDEATLNEHILNR